MKTVGQYIGFGLALAVGCASMALAYMAGRETGRSELSVTEAENTLIRQSVGVVVPIEDDSLTTADIAAFDREIWNLVSAGQALDEASLEVQTIQSRVSELEGDLEARDLQIEALQYQLSDGRLEREVEGAGRAIELEQDLDRVQAQLASSNRRIEQLNATVQDQSSRLNNQRERIEGFLSDPATLHLFPGDFIFNEEAGYEFAYSGFHPIEGERFIHSIAVRTGNRTHTMHPADRVQLNEKCELLLTQLTSVFLQGISTTNWQASFTVDCET